MIRVVAHRILWAIPLLLAVSMLSFVLVSLVPGNPAVTILGQQATAAQISALQRQLGLDQPIWIQYWHWLDQLLHGSLGRSLYTFQPVTTLLDQRLQASLSLVIGGTVLAGLLGVALGVASAVRGGIAGRAVDAAALLGLAIPQFWLGLVLVEIFGVKVHLFPTIGYTALNQSLGGWLRSLVLPVVTLAIGGMTVIAGQTRDSMLEVLDRDYIRVLRGNGFARWSVIYRHALKNAAIPVVTLLGIVFASLLSGTVLVEAVFGLPGLGSAVVQATTEHDIPVIQGAVLYFTVMVVIANLLIDVIYRLLDPRASAS